MAEAKGWIDLVLEVLGNPWVIGTLCAIAAQILAVLFGEILKMKPGFLQQRAGDWKFQLRTYPIVVGAACTFILLYQFLDLELAAAGGWILMSILNGALAWPLYDRLYEPLILPAFYRLIARVFKIDRRIARKEEAGEELSASENTVGGWLKKAKGDKGDQDGDA